MEATDASKKVAIKINITPKVLLLKFLFLIDLIIEKSATYKISIVPIVFKNTKGISQYPLLIIPTPNRDILISFAVMMFLNIKLVRSEKLKLEKVEK